jgi:hypothetical protein
MNAQNDGDRASSLISVTFRVWSPSYSNPRPGAPGTESEQQQRLHSGLRAPSAQSSKFAAARSIKITTA